MLEKKEADKFRNLIRHMSLEGCFNAPQALLEFAYWWNGRSVARDIGTHFKDMVRLEDIWSGYDDGLGLSRGYWHGKEYPEVYLRACEKAYPELYRYYRCDASEARQIERDAARMFCDALLSREELPAGEGWACVTMLAKWAYGLGAYDKVNALNRRGKLFSDTFKPFVTWDDKPDYPTVKQWDDKAIADMNDHVLWQEGATVALDDYDANRFDKWYPFFESRGLKRDQPVKVEDAVTLIRFMQQEGMKASVELLRHYLDDPYEDPVEVEKHRDEKTGELRPTMKKTVTLEPGEVREAVLLDDLADTEDYDDGHWEYFKSAKGVEGEYQAFLDRKYQRGEEE